MWGAQGYLSEAGNFLCPHVEQSFQALQVISKRVDVKADHGAEDCQRRIWRGNDSIRIENYGWHALPWQSPGLSGQLQC